MYAGYRLKINGVVFPNNYVSKGTYSCVENKRVVETWKDANHVEHEITTGQPKAVIKFSLPKHRQEQHSDIVAFFQSENDISIEYYADRRDTYRTATFRLKPIEFKHIHSSGTILYDKASVTLTEN